MIWGLLLVGAVFGLVVGYLVLTRKPKHPYLAISEYWVYLPGDQMPPQDRLLDRIVGKNPYRKPGVDPIGPAEGLVLSDVRLHIALVLRRKNPHVFRPDLFEDVDVQKEHLERLADSQSLVKLRYVSEEPLADKRHLQFLVHAADAMAELGDSKLIYDSTGRRLFLKEELEALLRENPDATRVPLHVRAIWKETAASCCAETRGLRKIGLNEIRTGAMEPDEKVLVTQLMELAVDELWATGTMPEDVEVEAYGDQFKLIFAPPVEEYVPARILRVQSA